MARLLRGTLLSVTAACLLYVAPAAAGTLSKPGCDGQRTTHEAGSLCARAAVSQPGLHAMRAQERRVAHAATVPRSMASNSDIVVAATAQNRECAILSCPSFLLVGVGY